MVLRADVNHTKKQTAAYLDDDQDVTQYILMLPDGQTQENARILVPDYLPLAAVDDYMTGTIMKVGNYLNSNDLISYALTDVPRKWYYSRIISLENIGTAQNPVYIKQSPWSQQILGGQQIIADEEPPIPTITLVRNATSEIVDE